MAIIKRDGVQVIPEIPDDQVLGWFMEQKNQSMAYHIKYDGYTVEYSDGRVVDKDSPEYRSYNLP